MNDSEPNDSTPSVRTPCEPSGNPSRWRPGQSGNPSGRRKDGQPHRRWGAKWADVAPLTKVELSIIAFRACGGPQYIHTGDGQLAAQAACIAAWLACHRPPVKLGRCAGCGQQLELPESTAAPMLAEDGCRVHYACLPAYWRGRWAAGRLALEKLGLKWWDRVL